MISRIDRPDENRTMPRPSRADEAGSIYHALNRGTANLCLKPDPFFYPYQFPIGYQLVMTLVCPFAQLGLVGPTLASHARVRLRQTLSQKDARKAGR